MSRLVSALAVPLLAGLASAAAAAPLEASLTNQSATLSYEIEVTGMSGGKALRQRLMVETPVFAREADALNPLGHDLTQSQNEEIAAMAAATAGASDGTAEILEANRLLEAMMSVCTAGEGPACAAARSRYQAVEQRMAEHGAATARAQAAVVRRDEDDHRFLTFAAGENGAGCGTVRYEHQLGERRIAGVYPDANSPESGLIACQTMAVLDRRDGSLALQMSPATLNPGDARIVDLQRLQGVAGLKFGALRMSLILPLQPTAGPEKNYSGARTIQAGGLSYTFRWTLKRG